MRQRSTATRRRRAGVPGGEGGGSGSQRNKRCSAASTPPAMVVATMNPAVPDTDRPREVAAANFTSPPPRMPRACNGTSNRNSSTATMADPASAWPPSRPRPAIPESAIPRQVQFGIVRVARSRQAAVASNKSGVITRDPLPIAQIICMYWFEFIGRNKYFDSLMWPKNKNRKVTQQREEVPLLARRPGKTFPDHVYIFTEIRERLRRSEKRCLDFRRSDRRRRRSQE